MDSTLSVLFTSKMYPLRIDAKNVIDQMYEKISDLLFEDESEKVNFESRIFPEIIKEDNP